MIALGARVSPTEVFYAIYDSDSVNVIFYSSVIMPKSLAVPLRLFQLKSSFLTILNQYKVNCVGIKQSEPNARSVSIDRIQLEASIIISCAEVGVKCSSMQISTLSALLGVGRSELKGCLDGVAPCGAVGFYSNWPILKKEQKEAVLAAMGAVHV